MLENSCWRLGHFFFTIFVGPLDEEALCGADMHMFNPMAENLPFADGIIYGHKHCFRSRFKKF